MSDIGTRIKSLRKKAGLTQPQLALKCGWESQSRISMYEKGHREPKRGDVEKIAEALNVEVAEILIGGGASSGKSNADWAPYEIKLWESKEDLNSDEYIWIPAYNVEAGAGNGHSNDMEDVKRELPFRKEFANRRSITAETGAMVYVRGDSMEPMLYDGDAILIDRSKIEIKSNMPYAVLMGGELRVKIIETRSNGGILLKSVNKPKWVDEEISKEELESGVVKILGMMVYRSGGGPWG